MLHVSVDQCDVQSGSWILVVVMVLVVVHSAVLVLSVGLNCGDVFVEVFLEEELPSVHYMTIKILLCLIGVCVIWHMYLHIAHPVTDDVTDDHIGVR